jgi:hypothetical protein
MSAANATDQLGKSDEYVITELRDPNKRSARLKWAKRELMFYAIGSVVLFVIAQILIFVSIYSHLYKDEALFFWATPFAILFLSLSVILYFSSSKAYTDVKAIHIYMALAQSQSAGSEK